MNIMSVICRSFQIAARKTLLVAIGALFLVVLSGAALADPILENGEYLIYTSSDLKVMADWVNNSTISSDEKYRLMEDIDLDGIDVNWLPIGVDENASFNGEFSGGGHTIRNFVISRNANYIGLFGVVSGDAQILDLRITKFDVRGNMCVGGLIGYNNGGTISTSYASGSVSGYEAVSGLVGINYEGKIISSYANVSVKGIGNNVGGLVGWNYIGTISTSYASGLVSGTGINVGGLVGWNYGQIRTSYASGTASGKEQVGGFVGQNTGAISTSYANGTVGGTRKIGGLVGFNLGRISTSYASGMVSGTGDTVGGLVGLNDGTIRTSYTSGAVSGTGRNIGGLVGMNSTIGRINPSYWLQDVAANINTGLKGVGLDDNVGPDDNVIRTDVTPLNLADMANRASFNAVSWDFYGDLGVTSPDWCYVSFNNRVAPALIAFFDPESAPDFNVINVDFIHIIPQSADLYAGEVKQQHQQQPHHQQQFSTSDLESFVDYGLLVLIILTVIFVFRRRE